MPEMEAICCFGLFATVPPTNRILDLNCEQCTTDYSMFVLPFHRPRPRCSNVIIILNNCVAWRGKVRYFFSRECKQLESVQKRSFFCQTERVVGINMKRSENCSSVCEYYRRNGLSTSVCATKTMMYEPAEDRYFAKKCHRPPKKKISGMLYELWYYSCTYAEKTKKISVATDYRQMYSSI